MNAIYQGMSEQTDGGTGRSMAVLYRVGASFVQVALLGWCARVFIVFE